MHPILFEFPGFPFYTQTLFFIIAFIAGLWVASREAKHFHISLYQLSNIVMIAFLGAILGARVYFLFFFREPGALNLQEVCVLGDIDGGFSFHGGLLAGALGTLAMTWFYRLNVWRVADVLAPALALAMFFMRLGCLFNGCDYGLPTTSPLGVFLHDATRHPIQLYEGIGNLLLLPLLIFWNRKPLRAGRSFLLYIFLSALLRFAVDFYREDPTRVSGQLLFSQLIAGSMALAALLILFSTILYNFYYAPSTSSDSHQQ